MTINPVFPILLVATFIGCSSGAPTTCYIKAATSCPFWKDCKGLISPTATTVTGTGCKGGLGTACGQIAKQTLGSKLEVSTTCSADATILADEEQCNLSGSSFQCDKYCVGSDNCIDIYGGTPAPPATKIKCHQCSSRTEGTANACRDSPPAATICDNLFYKRCATMFTRVFADDGTVLSDVVFRGCTAQSESKSTCKLGKLQMATSSGTKKSAMQCVGVCTGDNCNSKTDPFTVEKASGIMCETCLSSQGTCSSRAEYCADGEDYCYTKTVYMVGNTKNNIATDGTVLAETRSCAKTAKPFACTPVASGEVFKTGVSVKVCEGTCQGDDCNAGIAGNAKCSQCTGSYVAGNTYVKIDAPSVNSGFYDGCKNNAPGPKLCTNYGETSCVVKEQHMATSFGLTKIFTRACSKEATAAPKCETKKYWDDKKSYKDCKYVCKGDGCNIGNFDIAAGSAGLLASLTLLAVTLLNQIL